MLHDFIQQANEAAKLVERARAACAATRGLRSGDRVYSPLTASAEFDQGAAPSAELIFNVPADADFWAYRLLLYPFAKVVNPASPTNVPDEIVYRPTAWSVSGGEPGASNPASTYTDFNVVADASFAILWQGRELQNVDAPVAATYCADTLRWSFNGNNGLATQRQWQAVTQTPGGMVFDVPFFIARGKNLSVRVTPTYLGTRSILETLDDNVTQITRQHRYRITGVLEGEKKVSAFR